MQPIDFPEANKRFTKPEGWTDEECATLHVQDTGEELVSYWRPDDEERARLAAGAPVRLAVVGRAHPPVRVETGDAERGRLGILVTEDVRLEVLDVKPGDVVVVTLSGNVAPEHVRTIGELVAAKLRPTGVVGLVMAERHGAVASLDRMAPEDLERLAAAMSRSTRRRREQHG